MNKAYLQFLPIFVSKFDYFSKFHTTLFRWAPLWKIIKYGKYLAKNDENLCSTCLKPISLWLFQNPSFEIRGLVFRYPVPLLFLLFQVSCTYIWMNLKNCLIFSLILVDNACCKYIHSPDRHLLLFQCEKLRAESCTYL